jgi:HD-GYP domain-containing protein (c-di-GMP phosphodiesterase class II)
MSEVSMGILISPTPAPKGHRGEKRVHALLRDALPDSFIAWHEPAVPEPELVHIRRGALLHDIGKMGVPDALLLKPGPLTDGERGVLQRHPQHAFDCLSPIAFLRPALEIPYGHHERWDGTGYPRGLAGEGIPLAARIFAVVDIWDALTHDRPYREAWPEGRAIAHIRSLAGSHLDPRVVDAFLRLIGRGPTSATTVPRPVGAKSPRRAPLAPAPIP